MVRKINDKLTYQIIGCAMKVHNTLGNGFQEAIYQRCLAIEMNTQGLNYTREREIPIFYFEKSRDARILEILKSGKS